MNLTYTVRNPHLEIEVVVEAQSIDHARHVAEIAWQRDDRREQYPNAFTDGYAGIWLEVI